jgi:hypothetical protein
MHFTEYAFWGDYLPSDDEVPLAGLVAAATFEFDIEVPPLYSSVPLSSRRAIVSASFFLWIGPTTLPC